MGTGKSHLAIALGRQACRNAIPTRFFTASSLVMRPKTGQAGEPARPGTQAPSARPNPSSSTNWATSPSIEEGSRLLFQVISDSYETRSIIYTTNIEFSGWSRVFGDPNMAAAVIDRTVHHGRLIRFEGHSYRSEHALMTK